MGECLRNMEKILLTLGEERAAVMEDAMDFAATPVPPLVPAGLAVS